MGNKMKETISRWWDDIKCWCDDYAQIIIPCIIFTTGMWIITGTSGNLEYVKERAHERFKESNYKVVGYEGYKYGFWGYNNYGGAKVWYLLEKIPDNGILYVGCLQRWGDEIHLYELRAIDAIQPYHN